MSVRIKRLKDLKVALEELEPFVRNGRHLKSGRPFASMNDMRSRELLGNWLVCAVGNFENGDDDLTIGSSPNIVGGDGLVVSRRDENRLMVMEHVYVPVEVGANGGSIEAAVAKAEADKATKGTPYAKGKSLVVFSEMHGKWYPNRAAKAVADTHAFEEVWAYHLLRDRPVDTYAYGVSLLDVTKGDAPAWIVEIDPNFDGWRVIRIQ